MASSGRIALQNLRDYLSDRLQSSLHSDVPITPGQSWDLEDRFGRTPQQDNGGDCGVFSLILADFTAQCRELDYSQDDMPFFRLSIALAIFRKDL